MKALSQVNIPMFNTLRRTLIFFVYIVTVISGKRGRSVTSVFGLSVMLITTGALVAGITYSNTKGMTTLRRNTSVIVSS